MLPARPPWASEPSLQARRRAESHSSLLPFLNRPARPARPALFRFSLLERVLPAERQRLAHGLFVDACKVHERRAGETPRAGGRLERVGVVAKKAPLLVGRQHEPAPLRIVLDRAEDAAVRAEIRMPHVRALDDTVEREG